MGTSVIPCRGGRRTGGELHAELSSHHREADGCHQLVHGGCDTWHGVGGRPVSTASPEKKPLLDKQTKAIIFGPLLKIFNSRFLS